MALIGQLTFNNLTNMLYRIVHELDSDSDAQKALEYRKDEMLETLMLESGFDLNLSLIPFDELMGRSAHIELNAIVINEQDSGKVAEMLTTLLQNAKDSGEYHFLQGLVMLIFGPDYCYSETDGTTRTTPFDDESTD